MILLLPGGLGVQIEIQLKHVDSRLSEETKILAQEVARLDAG